MSDRSLLEEHAKAMRKLSNYSLEMDLVNRSENVCPDCMGLEYCDPSYGPVGIMMRYDQDTTEKIGYPVYRARHCPHEIMSFVDQRLGKRFSGRVFATFKERPANCDAYWAARQYAQAYEPGVTSSGLIFTGAPGVGKTHLAAAVLREVVRRGESSFAWVVVPEQEEPLSKYTGVRFLVLDDLTEVFLGGGFRRHDAKRDLYSLVNRRYEEELPTVVTSRMQREGMENALGEEVVGRLLEMCQMVHIVGASWRG